jgi:ABC-2 type transport system permease protein
MLNLIKADLYKTFHRMYLYVLMAVMSGLAILFNIVVAVNGASRSEGFGSILSILMIPLLIMAVFADIITSEENKEHTLKNTVSFGVSRSKLYLARNISSVLVATLTAAVTLVSFFGSGFLLLRNGNGPSTLPQHFALKIAVAFLIYLTGVIIATFLATVVKKNTMFAFSYYAVLFLPVLIFQLLSYASRIFTYAGDAMLLSRINTLALATPAEIMTTVWIALIHIVIFVALGLTLFKRQEIN